MPHAESQGASQKNVFGLLTFFLLFVYPFIDCISLPFPVMVFNFYDKDRLTEKVLDRTESSIELIRMLKNL
jgi:hypothetical protein